MATWTFASLLNCLLSIFKVGMDDEEHDDSDEVIEYGSEDEDENRGEDKDLN